MLSAIATFGGAATLEVTVALVGAPAAVAASRGVAGEVRAACAARPEARAAASAHEIRWAEARAARKRGLVPRWRS